MDVPPLGVLYSSASYGGSQQTKGHIRQLSNEVMWAVCFHVGDQTQLNSIPFLLLRERIYIISTLQLLLGFNIYLSICRRSFYLFFSSPLYSESHGLKEDLGQNIRRYIYIHFTDLIKYVLCTSCIPNVTIVSALFKTLVSVEWSLCVS